MLAHEEVLVAVVWSSEKPNRLLRAEPLHAPQLSIFEQTQQQLTQYFEGHRQQFDLPLIFYGTAFQQQVWRVLQHIPFGQSLSYGTIAKHINHPQAVRAVGAAVGRNPLSIIVPCHRVIGSTGQLTGFAGGIENKKWLLNHECIAYREQYV